MSPVHAHPRWQVCVTPFFNVYMRSRGVTKQQVSSTTPSQPGSQLWRRFPCSSPFPCFSCVCLLFPRPFRPSCPLLPPPCFFFLLLLACHYVVLVLVEVWLWLCKLYSVLLPTSCSKASPFWEDLLCPLTHLMQQSLAILPTHGCANPLPGVLCPDKGKGAGACGGACFCPVPSILRVAGPLRPRGNPWNLRSHTIYHGCQPVCSCHCSCWHRLALIRHRATSAFWVFACLANVFLLA